MSLIEHIGNTPFVSGKKETFQLSELPVSELILEHTVGALSGGATGALIPNTVIQWIKLKINGVPLIEWNGDVETDDIGYGIKLLREWNRLNNQSDEPAEVFRLILPDALPKNVNFEISWQWNTIGNINDGDRTSYTGTISIYYKLENKVAGTVVLMETNWTKFTYGTQTGNIDKFFNGNNFPSALIIMYLEDDGTASNDALSRLRITYKGLELFDGTYTTLRTKTQSESRIAPSTGFAIFKFPQPVIINANELKLKATPKSGGTNVELHIVEIGIGKIITKK